MILGTLCYLEQDGKVLMLYRNKKKNDMHEGRWVGLGGKLENAESPEECVIREFREESGLTLIRPRLRGILTFSEDSVWEDWMVFLFSAREYSGTQQPCDEGDLAWIVKEELHSLPMHEGDRRFLRLMEECEGVFSAKLYYEGNAFQRMDVMGRYPE